VEGVVHAVVELRGRGESGSDGSRVRGGKRLTGKSSLIILLYFASEKKQQPKTFGLVGMMQLGKKCTSKKVSNRVSWF